MAIDLKSSEENQDGIVAEINMTPLIDIMLVLLIIFMVTSSVSLESGLDIDLPKSSSTSKSSGPEAVISGSRKNYSAFKHERGHLWCATRCQDKNGYF